MKDNQLFLTNIRSTSLFRIKISSNFGQRLAIYILKKNPPLLFI